MKVTRTVTLTHISYDYIDLSTYEVTKNAEMITTLTLDEKVTAEKVAQATLGDGVKVLTAKADGTVKKRYGMELSKFIQEGEEMPLLTGVDEEE